MWNSEGMTSTTKTERVHSSTGTAASTLLGAASVVSKGPAGVGLLLAKRGYGLARKQAAQRRAATAERIARADLTKAALTTDRIPGNKRRVLALGAAAVVVGGVVFYLSRRRHEVPPPADTPPSLVDYEDESTSQV